MTLPAGTQIGKYVVRRKIAEGGMAEIYLAASVGPEGFHKDVVIKRIRSGLAGDPDFVEMFIAEARLASQINHGNVVQIFDFDKHEDTYYLAMEYVRGRSLWDVRKQSKARMEPMPPLLVAQIGLEVARALHSAHGLRVAGQPVNLVHRDVTPHNVLLSYEGAVKLTDFGIAKAGNRLSAAGVLKGKFAYMSPEQARGESVDHRTDVFALGIVLWELLTGGRLFEGDSDIAVLKAVQQSVIAPPRRLNPDVAPALDEAVMKALAREIGSRFQTAQELERALAAYVFANARSYDDTDVGGYVRRLFADELQAERELDHAPVRAAPAGPPPLPVRAPMAEERFLPGNGYGGTYVLQSAQRVVIAEASAADGVAAPSRGEAPRLGALPAPAAAAPPARTEETDRSAGSRPFRIPLGLGGAVLVGALAWVGLRSRRPPAGAMVVQTAAAKLPASQQGVSSAPATPHPQAAPAPATHEPVDAAPRPPAEAAPRPPVETRAVDPERQSPLAQGTPPSSAQVPAVPSDRALAPPVTASPPAQTPPAPTPIVPSGKEPSPPVRAGTVLVRVTPWAYFWIDGDKQRDLEGGARRIRLAPGDHQLRFSQNSHRVRNVAIHVEPGKTIRVMYNALTDTLAKP